MQKWDADILIIGGGPAGLTAAIYARRAGHSVLLLEGEAPGGQLLAAPRIENYPGILPTSGVELSERLLAQAEDEGVTIVYDTAERILSEGEGHTVVTTYGRYTAGAVIVAVGLRHRPLGIAREEELLGRGLSYCAVCDGGFFRGADVAVCGGGNTALTEALYLSGICRRVYLIHRRADFRAEAVLVERVRQAENITLCTEQTILAFDEGTPLCGLTLQSTHGEETRHLSVSGLFVAVGLIPRTELLRDALTTDADGFVPSGEDCRTERPGIFVAGDCRRKSVRQLATAVGDGATAATAACAYLKTLPTAQ